MGELIQLAERREAITEEPDTNRRVRWLTTQLAATTSQLSAVSNGLTPIELQLTKSMIRLSELVEEFELMIVKMDVLQGDAPLNAGKQQFVVMRDVIHRHLKRTKMELARFAVR